VRRVRCSYGARKVPITVLGTELGPCVALRTEATNGVVFNAFLRVLLVFPGLRSIFVPPVSCLYAWHAETFKLTGRLAKMLASKKASYAPRRGSCCWPEFYGCLKQNLDPLLG
jgi:hypothetical protein